MTGKFSCFLLFSLLVHLSVLLIWQQTAVDTASPGTTLELTLVAQSNEAVEQTAAPPATGSVLDSNKETNRESLPDHPQPHKNTNRSESLLVHTSPNTYQARAILDNTEHYPENPIPTPTQPQKQPASAPTTASNNAHLAADLTKALSLFITYPETARRRGLEGNLRISLRVEKDGQLSHIKVIASSGHSLLDQAAVHSLKRISAIAEALSWLGGQHFDMILPIEYRLITGRG